MACQTQSKMRISGGIAKGRRVILRKGDSSTRPTSAKVREAIFNILREKIIDCIFLDLYAGTGAVGIEAISRGAGLVIFVDNNRSNTIMIKKLIEKFGLSQKAKVFTENTLEFLKNTKTKFDIIFADPPYASSELDIVLPLIDNLNILNMKGLFVAEHPSKKDMPLIIGNLKLIKTYKYGDSAISIYKKEERT